MRIAIVGTGIAGLATAWLLNRRYSVTVFEAEPRLGGHTNTVSIPIDGVDVPVDTGFLVYNEPTYPLLSQAIRPSGGADEASSMSFSASIADGALEYGGGSVRSIAGASAATCCGPRFLRMLLDIRRFNRAGLLYLQAPAGGDETIGGFLTRHGFGRGLADWYLLPMAAAIWSAPVASMLDYPARSFLSFFANHGLLSVTGHHAWRTVTGGGRQYVERLVAEFRPRIRLATPITGVRRGPAGVEITDGRGERSRYDHVVLACHADQSLGMLEDATPLERSLLGAFRYQPNRAILHRDASLMPRRRAVWSAWNYLAGQFDDRSSHVSVTYWMNRLQNLPTRKDVFVSLNPLREPDPSLVHAEFAYAHPVFDQAAVTAQGRIDEIQGHGGVSYAGAWLGHGFHEDGLRSGLAAARALGVAPPWEAPGQETRRGALGLPEGAAALPA